MSRIYIYGLVDPRTEQIRYVGQTKDIKRRLKNHLNEAKKGVRSHKNSWVRKLLALKVKPKITVIEKCNSRNADERERYWIAHYRESEVRLTNQTDGGYGGRGYVRTEEERKLISKRMKGNKHGLGNKHTEEYKRASSERQKGRVFSKETKQKMSEARKKYFENEDNRKRVGDASRGRKHTEETKEKLRGIKHTKEARKKMSEASKNWWAKKRAQRGGKQLPLPLTQSDIDDIADTVLGRLNND